MPVARQARPARQPRLARLALAALALAGAAALSASPARAAFVLVDNLESRNLGPVNGQGNFSVIPENTSTVNVVQTDTTNGKVVQVGPVNDFAKALSNNAPAFAATPGSTATYFFQVQVPTASAGQVVDVSYGAGRAPTSASDFGAFNAQFRITGNAGAVSARNGGAFTNQLATVSTGVFNNVYLVVNTAASTYDIYLTTGSRDATAADRIATNLALRPPVSATNAFLGITGNATAATRFDNLYVDTAGVNLTNPVPIPEPTAAALVAGVAGALSLRRRRR